MLDLHEGTLQAFVDAANAGVPLLNPDTDCLRLHCRSARPLVGKRSRVGVEALIRYAKTKARPFTDQHGVRYESVRDAQTKLGVDSHAIRRVLNGKRSHVHGLTLKHIM